MKDLFNCNQYYVSVSLIETDLTKPGMFFIIKKMQICNLHFIWI